MNILAVSLAYPPLAYPRSIQVARLLKHVDAKTVMFCADEPGARLDPTIEPDAEEKLTACVRTPVSRNGIDRLVDRASHRFAPGIWNRRNLAPDNYGRWRSDVLGSVDQFLRLNPFIPDVIVSFAQPFSDHLIGLELKARLGLPWLAHFSDPWADNPFSEMDSKSLALNLELERTVAEAADILAFTSVETVDLFFAKYPAGLRKKARVLPQCYSPDNLDDSTVTAGGPLIVRYLGNFYGRRTPAPLIDALCEIHRATPELLEELNFELIGPGDAAEAERLSRELPQGVLRIKPSVNYRESLALMNTADGLLVIDAPADTSVFLPSKLIDYIGAGKPIMAISPNGAASGLVRELGGIVADPGDRDRIIAAIRSFFGMMKARRSAGSTSAWGDPEVRQRFTAENIAFDFKNTLAEIVR